MRKVVIGMCAVIVMLTFGSCKKDNSEKSKTELITQKGWIMTNMEFRSGNSGTWVVYPDFANADACDRDDVLLMKTDMTYELNEGNSRCDASDPQVYEVGAWTFQDNETKVVIDTEVVNLDQLDENTMVYSLTEVRGGISVTVRSTYRH